MVIFIPTRRLVEKIIMELRRMYPEDPIYPMRDYSDILYSIRYCMRRGRSRKEKIVWVATCLLYYIVSGHPLVDGNKRLAVSITSLYLLKNGYVVNDEILYSLAISIACRKKTLKGVYRCLYRNVRPGRK